MRGLVLLADGACSGGSAVVVRGAPATAFVYDNRALYRFDDLDDDGTYNGVNEQTMFFDASASPTGFVEVTGLLALDRATVLATNNTRINDTIPGVNNILMLHDADNN